MIQAFKQSPALAPPQSEANCSQLHFMMAQAWDKQHVEVVPSTASHELGTDILFSNVDSDMAFDKVETA